VRTRNRRALAVGVAGVVTSFLAASAVAVAAGPLQKGPGLARGVHTDISLIKADGTKDAFAVDRGTVTAMSQSSFTLQRKDGVSVTLGINGDTKVRGDIQVGKGAVTVSRSGVAARVLAAKRASLRLAGRTGIGQLLARARLAQARFGAVHADVELIRADTSTDAFTFDRGKVSAASSTSVTVERPDGQKVTKGISADTKLRGKLVVGGRAAVFSRSGTAFAILAVASQS
jgi:hypothetical protein